MYVCVCECVDAVMGKVNVEHARIELERVRLEVFFSLDVWRIIIQELRVAHIKIYGSI